MTTVIIPSRGRPDLITKCLQSLFEGETLPARVVVVVDDDPPTVAAIEGRARLEILANAERLGFWQSLARALENVAYDEPFCYFGQDVTFDRCWLVEAEKAYYPDGLGLLAFRDDIHNGANASHGMTTKKWFYVIWGKPSPPEVYFHHFCDSELSARSMDLKRFTYCKSSRVPHHHAPLIVKPLKFDKLTKERRHLEWVNGGKEEAICRLNEITGTIE